jgi:glycine cleavage system H protein
MSIPKELRYTKEHEWVLAEDDVLVVGITDFAQTELGDVVYVELPGVGTKVAAGETLGNVESVKSVSDLFSPISGIVSDVNTRLAEAPELVNSDPYGEGWLFRIEPENVADLEQLLGAGEYSDYIGAEAE